LDTGGGGRVQDGVQMLMHYGEHKISSNFYKASHKPHHRFINPRCVS
jgi:hypothetical protein